MDPNRPAAVVILAAGQGTRMRSAQPKVLHEICGRSLLGHALAAAEGLHPDSIVVVVRHERDAVARHARACDPNVVIADQDEIPGTGRAVWCALQELPHDLTGSVVVMAGDVPLLDTASLQRMCDALGTNAVSVLTTQVKDPTGYGRIVRDEAGHICGVVEHKDATAAQREIYEINTSTYSFDLTFLRDALTHLSSANAQGELYLTDVIARAYTAKAGVSGVVLEDSWLVEGCNDLVQLAALRAEMNRRVVERWMRAGVRVVDPATTQFDVTASAEADAQILPGTHLAGATHVEPGAIVGPGIFTDCHVGAAAVAQYVVADQVDIPAGAHVPAFSVLPAGAVPAGGSDVLGTSNK